MKRPRVGGIIACRMDSRRLPGKVLRPVRSRPLLWYVVTRCRQVPELAQTLAVATTEREVDHPIVQFCQEHGLLVYRGATNDVAGRLLAAAQQYDFDWFFRLNGDSPFVEPSLLGEAWRIAAAGRPPLDFVTNLLPRSYPYGVSVELLRTEAFAAARREMSEPAHLEHVTLFLYSHLERFRYYNLLRVDGDVSGVRLTIDTGEDLERFDSALGLLGERWAEASYTEAMTLYRNPDFRGRS